MTYSQITLKRPHRLTNSLVVKFFKLVQTTNKCPHVPCETLQLVRKHTELEIVVRKGYRRTVAPVLSLFQYVGIEEHILGLGFARDLAGIETGGVFAK